MIAERLEDGTRYLPDFWLPAFDAWIEVKPEAPKPMDKSEEIKRYLGRYDGGSAWAYDGGRDNIPNTTHPSLIEASKKARSARFEFGENA